MSVEAKMIESECKLHAIVIAHSIANEVDLRAILVDLDAALDILRDKIDADGASYHEICLQVEGVEPEFGAFEGTEISGGTHDPWTSFSPAFWTKLANTPSLESELLRFLGKFRALLEYGNNTLFSPMSEGDETQFGEPILAHLALTNPRFIPIYMEFLELWDMDHEVEISGAILEILETYPADINAKALREHCKNAFAGTDLASQL